MHIDNLSWNNNNLSHSSGRTVFTTQRLEIHSDRVLRRHHVMRVLFVIHK